MKIFIATPAYNGQITTTYLNSVLKVVMAGLPVAVSTIEDSLITRSRNDLVAQFLSDESYTHIFFIDSDIGFTLEQFCKLVDSPHLVTAGAYPFKKHFWSGQPVVDEKQLLRYVLNFADPSAGRSVPEDGLVEVLDAATGFMCIKREALELMVKFYPELAYFREDRDTENNYLFFDTMVEDGRYLSEDYAFCRRWQQTGGSIWLDLDSKLTHVGPKAYEGDLLLTNAMNQKTQPAQKPKGGKTKKGRGKEKAPKKGRS